MSRTWWTRQVRGGGAGEGDRKDDDSWVLS